MGINQYSINEGVSCSSISIEDISEEEYAVFKRRFPSAVEALHEAIKIMRNTNFDNADILYLADAFLDKLCYFNLNYLRNLNIMEDKNVIPSKEKNDSRSTLAKNKKFFILNKDKLMSSVIRYDYTVRNTMFENSYRTISTIFNSMCSSQYTERIVPIPAIFEEINGNLISWGLDDYMSAIYSTDPGKLALISTDDSRSINLSDIRYDLYEFLGSEHNTAVYPTVNNGENTINSIYTGIKIRKQAVYDLISKCKDDQKVNEGEIKDTIVSIINYTYVSCFLAKSELDRLDRELQSVYARNKMILDFVASLDNPQQ